MTEHISASPQCLQSCRKVSKTPFYPPQTKDFASQPITLAALCAVSRLSNSRTQQPRQQPYKTEIPPLPLLPPPTWIWTRWQNHVLTARKLKRKSDCAVPLSWLISARGEVNRRSFPINTHHRVHPRTRQAVILSWELWRSHVVDYLRTVELAVDWKEKKTNKKNNMQYCSWAF